MSLSFKERLQAFFQPADEKLESDQRLGLSQVETENNFLVGAQPAFSLPRDRQVYDRQQIMLDSLDAWRFNPVARRIVELTTQYAAGGGMVVTCSDKPTQVFITEFWQHRLNLLDQKINQFSDELCLSGNLFLMLSSDQSGMTYLRIVPAADVLQIQSRENDIEQELAYHVRQPGNNEPLICQAYDPRNEELDMHNRLPKVMLHFAINRPSGSQWGEGDLTPVLKWLSRYSAWLEDRVRLNRFRNAFVYVVKARFGSENERYSRQLQLAANPPAPGSVLVTDESEEWSVLSPKLEALDASSDGLAIKKMIAAGLLERGLIDNREYLRLVYRFMGERVPDQSGSDGE